MWIFYALVTQLGLYGIQTLKIQITIDNKTVFKYGHSEEQFQDPDLNITKSINDFSRRKSKRAVPTESLSGADENGPCKFRSDVYGKSMGSTTFHQAMVADEHSRVMLICHYCNDSDELVYDNILWYRVSRSIYSQINITEVVPDMHDDEERNRVVISPAHTLTFKSVVTADAGGYFCRSQGSSTSPVGSNGFQTNASALTELLTVPGQFSFFYHLDVLPPIGIKVRHVSLYGHDHPKPQRKVISTSRNLIFFTDWQEWTRCSTCGNVGERKRYGVRMIAKYDPNNASTPWFLDKILSTFTKGVPCRSTLLKEVKGLFNASDEIETELCDVACHRKWIYSDDDQIRAKITNEGWRDLRFDTEHKVIKKALTGRVGEVFKMKCPGATVDSMVWWKNGTTSLNSFTISERSGGRVYIDSLNNLVISSITSHDTGKYSCWINGKLWALMKLNVFAAPSEELNSYQKMSCLVTGDLSPDNTSHDMGYRYTLMSTDETERSYIVFCIRVWYHAPYFCTVVSFHFWVFIATLLLRHAYRQVSRSNGRPNDKGGKKIDAQEDDIGERAWIGRERRNEEERLKKMKRLEKYGDGFNRNMVSGVDGYVGEGEAESLIEPWKDVRK